MTSFFHAYDLRGKYPEEISEAEAERVGKAYGTYVEGKVLVARDGRTHAEEITEAFVKGLKSTGADILDAGMVPTPVAYFSMVELEVPNCAVVTASHNPSEYTGFKFSKKGGLAMSREGGMAEIETIYESSNFEEGRGSIEKVEVTQQYIKSVSRLFDVNLDVVVNYGNGVAASIGSEVLEEIGCSVKEINSEINGEFPNHLPAPHEEEAQEALKKEMEGEDLGIIFDGDGDRSGFLIDGNYVSEDKVLAIFSEHLLKQDKGKVVHDLRASKLVKERIKTAGGEPMESRVGHTFISEAIHRDKDIVFAGELSGHYYFPSLGFPWDDGILAACLMCQIIEEGGAKKLESYPDYPVSPELRIDCPHDRKQTVVDKVAEKFSDKEINDKDGVKISFEKGWALVRPSNTEEKMSVRVEAETEEDLEQILEKVESTVRGLC